MFCERFQQYRPDGVAMKCGVRLSFILVVMTHHSCKHFGDLFFFQVDTLRQGKVSRKVIGCTSEMLRGGLQDFPSPSTSRRAQKNQGKSQHQGQYSRSWSKHASRGSHKQLLCSQIHWQACPTHSFNALSSNAVKIRS